MHSGSLISLSTTHPGMAPSRRGVFLSGRAQRSHRLDWCNRRLLAALLRKMRKPTPAERWAKMAEEARAIATRTRDPAAKETMLKIAASYDRLAKKSEELARRRAGKSEPTSD